MKTDRSIYFMSKYKYQLTRDYHIIVPIKPEQDIDTEYIQLNVYGYLTIKKGYAWDGPSGPTFDTNDFMRGALVHDALYQIIREGYLDSKYRKDADEILRRLCLEDGMPNIRASYVYSAVKRFASYAAEKHNCKKELCSPIKEA